MTAKFIKPPSEVLVWLVKHGANIRDIYRLVIKRDKKGGALLTFYQWARNKEDKRYKLDSGQMAVLEPIHIGVPTVPEFVKLDLYGYELDKCS